MNVNNFEKFTNADYKDLEELDFRSLRYKKRHRKLNSQSDLCSEQHSEKSIKERSGPPSEQENPLKANEEIGIIKPNKVNQQEIQPPQAEDHDMQIDSACP